jgi:hypothetical protein
LSVWYFEERDPRGVQTAPKDEEHFAAVSGVVTSLVRETSQNSGDAWARAEPVQMQFRFGRLDGTRFADYVDGLPPHLTNFPDERATLEGNKRPAGVTARARAPSRAPRSSDCSSGRLCAPRMPIAVCCSRGKSL